ncbi:uncharacterized protein LOC111411216 [Olea europaea var. sylvestris]|uniref:uncharacterized protein LOC111411216 n=1 Tax=Olea europaea var. sylvestris TaxID=158386 RepID=UPI000C1D106E|nr:uncharacterized protein LOC111411216 [Olea europaea var. sylvestris]
MTTTKTSSFRGGRGSVRSFCLYGGLNEKPPKYQSTSALNRDFLRRVLEGLGFPTIFIDWVIKCITTPTYSTALNRSIHGFFKGKKGLRQGDPLSPFLFVLCLEYFSRMVKGTTENSEFNFHPKYASLRRDVISVSILMDCFTRFGDMSRLKMNLTNLACIPQEFMGRMELVRSVLKGVECFWLSIFPILATIASKVISLCRNFLWESKKIIGGLEQYLSTKA